MLISVDLSPHPSLLPKCYQVNPVLAAFPDSPKILQDKETYWEHFLDFWGLRKFVEESSKAPRKEDTATLEGEALLDGDDLKPVSDTVQSMLQKGDDLLAEEEVRLKTCIEALEAEESFLMKYLQPEDPLVGLNINGTVLMASLRVLQFFPDSVLGVTFNRKRWAEQERDLDGSGNYVMDYDAYCFSKLLEILRILALYGQDKLTSWVDFNATHMGRMNRLIKYLFPGREEEMLQYFYNPKPFLLREVHAGIVSFLPDHRFELLYRSSRDGCTADAFHRLCDNQGPTIMVVRSKEGYICGGYADKPWRSIGKCVSDANAFLFSIKNPAGLLPLKLGLKDKRSQEHALYDNKTFGFGGLGLAPDLGIIFGDGVPVVVSDLGQRYKVPQGQTFDFLMGKTWSSLEELEVYKVTK